MTCNNRHVPLLACLLAGAAFASCRGAAIHEAMPDGGGAGAGGGAGNGTGGTARGGGGGAGTSGPAGAAGPGGSGGSASGTGGRGGSAGGGRGGAAGGGAIGGVGCAAQMQPTLFWEGQSSPVSSDGTSTRYYWVEFDPPNFTVRYLLGAPPANEYKHPFQVEASVAGMFNVAISETRVAATWNDVGEVAVYGADYDSVQIGQTLTLDNRSAVTLAGTMVYYSHNAAGGNPTPGIYQWQPPAAATLFESFSQLASDATFGQLLRTTQSKLLLSDHTDVRMVTISPTKTAAGLLFVNFFGHPVMDVRPARPHDHDGGVIVQLQDDALFGRDYYTDVTAPENPPTDLGAATSALADASACGAAAHYHGPGVLFGQRYIYEGQAGLFAVDVSTAGAVSNLIRLTDLPLLRPEVTGAGDLFAVAATPSSSLYYYYRVGKF